MNEGLRFGFQGKPHSIKELLCAAVDSFHQLNHRFRRNVLFLSSANFEKQLKTQKSISTSWTIASWIDGFVFSIETYWSIDRFRLCGSPSHQLRANTCVNCLDLNGSDLSDFNVFTALWSDSGCQSVNVNGQSLMFMNNIRVHFFLLSFHFQTVSNVHLIFIVELIAIFHRDSKNKFHWAYENIYACVRQNTHNFVCGMSKGISMLSHLRYDIQQYYYMYWWWWWLWSWWDIVGCGRCSFFLFIFFFWLASFQISIQ